LKMISKYTTLLIDDEALARERLKKMLLPYADKIEIIGEARNGNQAIEMIERLKPDLIFLDIQMPGKSGFEVLQAIHHQPIVIFCTAHDEYALQAFETSSIDYLLKPVKEDRLEKAINKLHLFKTENRQSELETFLSQQLKQISKKEISSIPVKIADRVIFVSLDEISHFTAEDKYVSIHTTGGKEYVIDHSLNYLSEKLDEKFVRIQRSCIVNLSYIKEIKRYMGGRFVVKLNNQKASKIISGRNYQEQVKDLMLF
ncbi:LytR/AlgR family response regulator transcription factor, partial [Ancylomarina sp.]|uniref:LytR/AlgR family response regulator transcription factor n=1 Tax=Ancylomarina sp. TaxID=1970196 RepID=UPI0035632328